MRRQQGTAAASSSSSSSQRQWAPAAGGAAATAGPPPAWLRCAAAAAAAPAPRPQPLALRACACTRLCVCVSCVCLTVHACVFVWCVFCDLCGLGWPHRRKAARAAPARRHCIAPTWWEGGIQQQGPCAGQAAAPQAAGSCCGGSACLLCPRVGWLAGLALTQGSCGTFWWAHFFQRARAGRGRAAPLAGALAPPFLDARHAQHCRARCAALPRRIRLCNTGCMRCDARDGRPGWPALGQWLTRCGGAWAALQGGACLLGAPHQQPAGRRV
jgi:hypothetical protein